MALRGYGAAFIIYFQFNKAKNAMLNLRLLSLNGLLCGREKHLVELC